jgi:hypothetical protein
MFSKTKVIPNVRNSSIIVKFDNEKGISELTLPYGFEEFPDHSYEQKKELFFQTYHTYRKFINEKRQLFAETKNKVDNSQLENDVVTEDNRQFQFKDNITGEVITYQKLVMFDSILDAYNELQIQALQDKLSRSTTIDYSKLHKYLHQGVFLAPHDDFFIDEIDLPKKILNDASTEIVEIFCYIYSEIVKEFGQAFDNNKVLALTNNFKENRLFEESSLFAEDTYEDTLNILKEVLEEIDRVTPYKDSDYWHFYEAVYNFLYSNNDGIWSLDNFSFIWERMCISFAKKYYPSEIELYDNFGALIDESGVNIKNSFKITLNSRQSDNVVRYLRPDLILNNAFSVKDNYLEALYSIDKKGDVINLSIRKDVRQHAEIEKLKIEEFKELPRIKSFFIKTGFYPPTFTVSIKEFEIFNEKAKVLMGKRDFFDYTVRDSENARYIYHRDNNNSYLVVDFKYMGEKAFDEPLNAFIQKAVNKQLVYELALKLNINSTTKSEFWIPGYLPRNPDGSSKSIRKYIKNCDAFFQKYRISVIQLDFITLQQIYITDGI